MIGYILAKVAEIALDVVDFLLTSVLGWVLIGSFAALHLADIYTLQMLLGDLTAVFWETLIKPLIDWVVSTLEQIIRDTISDQFSF